MGEIEVLDAKLNTVTISSFQAIPGSDQNASPTNKETAGRKLERTS